MTRGSSSSELPLLRVARELGRASSLRSRHPVVGGGLRDRGPAPGGEVGQREGRMADAERGDLLELRRERVEVELPDRLELLLGRVSRCA